MNTIHGVDLNNKKMEVETYTCDQCDKEWNNILKKSTKFAGRGNCRPTFFPYRSVNNFFGNVCFAIKKYYGIK